MTRYTVAAATGKGGFILDADEVELTDTWAIFRRDGEIEQAFAVSAITHIAALDENDNPRGKIYARGMQDYDNL